jgi:short-subunit dehydrogenase/acyl carrier protein
MREADEPAIALRHGHRWKQEISPTAVLETAPEHLVRDGGVYVITGGSGGVGLAIARTLASRAPIHLALVSRHGANPVTDTVASIELSASTVCVYQADCADRSAMAQVFADVRRRHTSIHGVVHAAGVAGGGVLARRTDQEIAAVLRPKTIGADVVADLAADMDLDFLVLCSSLNVYLPVPGQADYAAANAYLDAKAALLRRSGVRAISINWDAWREIGMAATANVPAALRAARAEELATIGLDPERACEAFLTIAASDLGQVIVSRRQDVTGSAVVRASAVHAGQPPTGVTESLAQIWKTLLGVTDVKPADDFFELGGHSLLATSLIFQVRQTFGCAISVDEVFAHSTFHSLAALVEARTASEDREALLL